MVIFTYNFKTINMKNLNLSKYERTLEAQNIVDDITAEHGEDAPFGTITLEEAIDTVETYGYEGKDLQEISRMVVVIMEGILED
jgi:hypothetical protein